MGQSPVILHVFVNWVVVTYIRPTRSENMYCFVHISTSLSVVIVFSFSFLGFRCWLSASLRISSNFTSDDRPPVSFDHLFTHSFPASFYFFFFFFWLPVI
jgi:hypothetical protein